MSEVVKPKKKTFKERINSLVTGFANVFKDYPITLGIVIALAFLGAILIDIDDKLFFVDTLETIAIFLCIFSAGSLFSEQLFKVKKSIGFIVSLSVNLIISIFYTWEAKMEAPWLFGIQDAETRDELLYYTLFCYIITLCMVSLYSMYKRSESNFENFCVSAFTELFKTGVVYAVFAIGLLIIMLIFDYLIADSGYFIERIEIFLLGAVLAPLSIKALSRIRTEATKFAKVMILYVLMPLLALAYLVIYIYILKIVFTLTLPSNEVFNIVAFLFCIGMPIWTMAQNFKDAFIGKVSKCMPYAFLPLLILQAVCIGIRVGEYGVTEARYWAVMLVIAEIIYEILYVLQVVKKKTFVAYSFIVVPVLVFIGTLMPVFNSASVVIASQKAIFDKYYKDGDISEKDQAKAKSAYNEIGRSGYRGKAYLDKNFSHKLRKEISDWGDTAYFDYDYSGKYYSFYNDVEEYDIAGYSKMYSSRYDYIDGNDIDEFVIRVDDGKVSYEIDFSDIIPEAIEYYDEHDYSNASYLMEHPYFDDGKYRVYIKHMNFNYGIYAGVSNFSVNYILLEK